MMSIQKLINWMFDLFHRAIDYIQSSKTTYILISLLLSLLLILRITSQRSRSHALPPSPRALPILGHVHHVLGDGKTTFEGILKLFKQFKSGPFTVDLMSRRYVLISSARHAEILLKNTAHKSDDYKTVKTLMGKGLFTCEDMGLWKYNRKIISPFFRSMKFITHYIPVYMQESRALVEKIPVGEPVNIFHMLGRTTLTIICRTGIGVPCSKEQCESFIRDMDRVLRVWHQRIFQPWLMIDWIFKRTEYCRIQDAGIKGLRDFAWQMVAERRRIGENEGSNLTLRTFVDAMLEEYDPDKEEDATQILDEVITVLVGGQETTATELGFALVLLAMHPDIQDKAYKELSEVLKRRPESDITFDDLEKLIYLDCVINETIRMFPALPLVSRELQDDTNFGDYVLPKGLSVPIFIYETHRNKDIWEFPHEFRPERFLSLDTTSDKSQFAYIPFASGVRSCIGKKYALLQVKAILCTVIRHFRVKPTPQLSKMEDIILEVNTTLKIYGGFNVMFEKREPCTFSD